MGKWGVEICLCVRKRRGLSLFITILLWCPTPSLRSERDKLGMEAQTVTLALSMWSQEDWESEASPG